ncbi:MFS transporter [Bacillus inaquosorum]|uniref:MFS transporter n=1 Tax=Bacillus inaquosorum TaxID=483913 RepID=UPI0022828464|nr:MFS transporter [Bacillus inaquosorum]MCY8724158.1 MFS transporter [Bacillus inaquosorum]MCY9310735.1 MFS transporter [Bacillus inaquosorum]MEC0637700.1 MFS transporter [Bacillus inaquosorum]MED0796945.1 MFS transporter [Bacillus inaquosorum]
MNSKQNNDIETKHHFPLFLALALTMGVFAAGSEELVISPLLPDLAKAFNSDVSVLALSISIYGVMIFIGAPLLVPLGDKYSRELSLLAGLMIFIIGTVICALAQNIFFFFLGRALSGLAAGAFVPTAYAVVGDRVPYTYRGKVMGLIVSSWSLALIFGVPLGSFIGGVLHWRWTFWIFALMGVLVVLLILLEMRRHAEHKNNGKEEKEEPAGTFRDALKVPRVPVYITITFCNMIGFYGMYSFLGSYLQDVFTGGNTAAGLFIMIYGIGFSMSVITGKMADRIGKMRSLLIALGVISVLLACLAYAPASMILLIVKLFIWGLMQSLTVTLLSTILSDCSERHRGKIMAFYSLASNLAVTLGSALMGPVYVGYGYAAVGFICAAITVLGFVLSVFAYKKYGKHEQKADHSLSQ